MKYIIILLTSLFLVSNASADTIRAVCKYQEREIINTYTIIDRYVRMRNEALQDQKPDDTIKQYNETIDRINNDLKEEAKTYHYLDCSDFRR